MSMDDVNVNDALNHCLELLDQGLPVEECLRRYPALSEELAPLLQLAARTRSAAEAVAPSPEAQRAGLGRVTEAWAAMEARRRRGERGLWRRLRRSWALAAVAALALVFGGWTTTAAAQDSVPGDTLYPVKRTHERVLLLVILTDGGKADLHARFAHARTLEAARLAARGDDPAALDKTLARMETHTRQAVSLMGGRLSPDAAAPDQAKDAPHAEARGYLKRGVKTVNGEMSLDRQQFWADAKTRFVRPWHGKDSKRRFAMQERFFQQFLHYQQMRDVLPSGLQPPQRARLEAGFARSEYLLLEAFLVMQALENAQYPRR